jgi:hypothetical protein
VGQLLFKSFMMVFPHGPAGVRACCVPVVKDLPIVRGRLSALLLFAQSSAHSAALSLGVEIQSGKRGQSVLFINEAYDGRGMLHPQALKAL